MQIASMVPDGHLDSSEDSVRFLGGKVMDSLDLCGPIWYAPKIEYGRKLKRQYHNQL